jgi:hypothetical protein
MSSLFVVLKDKFLEMHAIEIDEVIEGSIAKCARAFAADLGMDDGEIIHYGIIASTDAGAARMACNVHRVQWMGTFEHGAPMLPVCPECRRPTHASESNDEGVCERCLGDDAIRPSCGVIGCNCGDAS